MAFASGPVSFRRFFISGTFPSKLDDGFLEALNAHAFGRQKTAAPDGTEVGWITSDHLFDSRFTALKTDYDRFTHFQMRFDRTAPPPAVVRAYTRIEEAAARGGSTGGDSESGGGPAVLSRNDRVEARRRALDRAQEEAKKGLFRRIAGVPILVDLPARTVYFGNLGAAAADKFIGLFRDTFDASLEPATSDALAHRIMDAAGDPRSIEDTEPFHLVPAHRVTEDNGFDFNDRTFFGREFLTWLWYQTDRKGSTFDLARRPTSVLFTGTLRLDCDFKMTGSDTIRCEGPAAAPEARAALPLGKQPTQAGLLLSTAAAEYALVLDAPRFNVSALRLPDAEQPDPRARLEDRFAHITEAAGILDMLFGLFLGRRAAPTWPKELAAIKAWAAGAADPAAVTLRFPAEVATR